MPVTSLWTSVLNVQYTLTFTIITITTTTTTVLYDNTINLLFYFICIFYLFSTFLFTFQIGQQFQNVNNFYKMLASLFVGSAKDQM